MLAGALTADNLSMAMRDISQRRRQGTLEVTRGQERLDIIFIQGRVVEVCQPGQPAARAVYGRLSAAGYAAPGLTIEGEISYAALYSQLSTRAAGTLELSEDVFRLALKERVLEELYSLWFRQDGVFSFQARMVEVEKDMLPSISVGQLLLDVVELQSARERLAALPDDRLIEQGSLSGQALGLEEETVVAVVGSGCLKGDLEQKSILSGYHLCEALLSLLDRGVLVGGSSSLTESQGDVDALMAALEKSVDDVFEPLPEDEAAPLAEPAGGAHGGSQSAISAEQEVSRSALQSPEGGDLKMKEGLPLESTAAPLGQSFNTRLLQSSLILDVMVVLLVASALLSPFLLWFGNLTKLADLQP